MNKPDIVDVISLLLAGGAIVMMLRRSKLDVADMIVLLLGGSAIVMTLARLLTQK